MDDSDGDDEEGEEAPTHTFDDDSEDDTAHPQQLLSFVGRNLNARDLVRAPTANFSVRYSKSLKVGVKKKKIIPLGHVAHELTNRTYGEKKWWVVIVKDQ